MTDNRDTLQDRKPCAAKGCNRWAAGFTRFCPSHRYRYHYTRDPNGRILRKGRDLGPYRDMVNAYLPRWKDHEAFTAAFRWLESLLADGSTYTGPVRVHREIARELRRLRLDGATGEAMFRKVAAVAGYAHFHKHDWDSGPVHTANIGHHLLRTTPRPGAGKGWGNATYEVGRMVREVLDRMLFQFWEAIERDVTKQARERAAINEALQREPLAAVHSPSEYRRPV